MGISNDHDEQGYVVLDPEQLEQLRLEKGLSRRQFAELAHVAPTTAYRFFNRQRVQTSTARRLFDGLDIEDMRPYLIRGGQETGDQRVLAEWQIDNALTKPVTLSNGLEFRVCQLSHKVLPATLGRGKCYDLRKLNTRDSDRVQEQLLRHPTVCRLVGEHPQLPVNERVLYSEDRMRFWVIDRWFDGVTLEDKLRYGPLEGQQLAKTMLQILAGLEALHANHIIRRELSPQYIVLAEPRADVLLTELELSKLLEGAISVSETWSENPFLAPEIENDELSFSVDLYSWAQMLVFAASGRLPASPANPEQLDGLELPDRVRKVARRCLSLGYKFRPQRVQDVLEQLEGWRHG